jgi:hypothetical protein
MTGILASLLASLPAWVLSAVLDGHVSMTVDLVLSFIVWSVAYVPIFIWLKRMKEG